MFKWKRKLDDRIESLERKVEYLTRELHTLQCIEQQRKELPWYRRIFR